MGISVNKFIVAFISNHSNTTAGYDADKLIVPVSYKHVSVIYNFIFFNLYFEKVDSGIC